MDRAYHSLPKCRAFKVSPPAKNPPCIIILPGASKIRREYKVLREFHMNYTSDDIPSQVTISSPDHVSQLRDQLE